MPKKKAPKNAYYFYMQEQLPELKRQGRVFPNGLQDVAEHCRPYWKALPEEEKERYENMAKEYKARMKGREGDKFRMDNVGNILSERKDPTVEMDIRRKRESKLVKSKWPPGRDLIYEKFYLINFQTLCKTEEGEYRPIEIGVVEYSMYSGITKVFQRFIYPGPIPLGYRFTCQQQSDDTHKIPIENFELFDHNYRGIWIQLENFVNPSGEKEDYPPFFCLSTQVEEVIGCLEYLHAHACIGIKNRLYKVFQLETLVCDIYSHLEKNISYNSAHTMLITSVYDYAPKTMCEWHEEHESKFCSIGICKIWAYAISDALQSVYDFHFTEKHLPKHSDELVATVIEPTVSSVQDKWQPRQRNRDSASTPSSGFPATDIRFAGDNDPYDSQSNITSGTVTPVEATVATAHSSGLLTPAEPAKLRRPTKPGKAALIGQQTASATMKSTPWGSTSSVNSSASATIGSSVDDWPSLGGQSPARPTVTATNLHPAGIGRGLSLTKLGRGIGRGIGRGVPVPGVGTRGQNFGGLSAQMENVELGDS